MPAKRQFRILRFPGAPQNVSKIADLTGLIDAHIEERSAASQGKSRLRSLPPMIFQERLQGKIGDHIAVVAEDGLVLGQEIFDVFQPARRVEEDRLVPKEHGRAAPLPVGEFLSNRLPGNGGYSR